MDVVSPSPATACLVQDALGAATAAAFDLSAGCTGFVYGLSVAADMIVSGGYEHALVIGAETLRQAQQDPERHRDLIVRVAGYSDYFVDVGRDLQNEIIARTEQQSL